MQILDFRHWDLVDQLWSYLVDAVESLVSGEKAVEFYFPDQPLLFKMKVISDFVLLLELEDMRYSVNRQEFLGSLLKGAESFFLILSQCVDENIIE
jgi:hypothetical protein